tara:strand:- start:215 stop:454 length:240 start_codon:yes stop_codon:yes gene_type:complete
MTNFANELRATLESSVAKFTYRKKDGQVREAVGTRNLSLIPSEVRPRWEIQDPNLDKAVVYYDFDESAFRSISVAANTY